MTGGGDLDEFEADDETLDVADEDDDVDIDELDGTGGGGAGAPAGGGMRVNENDPDPTAGASDVGGLPGNLDDDDARGDDGHEPGGGQTGMGKGPTGS